MAFEVTPDTVVSEASMFHGACVSLTTNDGLAATPSIVQFDTVVYDTDGFWDNSTKEFDIPDGVSYVQMGCNVSGFGTAGDAIETFIRAQGGTRGVVRVAQAINAHASHVAPACNVITAPLHVDAGESFRVYAKYVGTGVTLQGNNANYPNYFWIRVIKDPFGHPASPTLP